MILQDLTTHILLTHSHPDHMGTAERIRRESNATVWIHEMDADTATTSQAAPPPTRLLTNLWRPTMLKMFVTMIRDQAMNAQPVEKVSVFANNETLTIPGSPFVIHIPGHTKGSCAFYFKDDQLLFSGDALVTFNLFQAKKSPPMLAPGEDKNVMRQSLNRFKSIEREQVLLLPGHGDPWFGVMTHAISEALP